MAMGFCTSGSEAKTEIWNPGGPLIFASVSAGGVKMWLGASVLNGVGKGVFVCWVAAKLRPLKQTIAIARNRRRLGCITLTIGGGKTIVQYYCNRSLRKCQPEWIWTGQNFKKYID